MFYRTYGVLWCRECFFLVEIARVSERFYPLYSVFCRSVCLCRECCYVFNLGGCFAGRKYLYMWWTVFIVRLYNTAENTNIAKETKMNLVLLVIPAKTWSSTDRFYQQLPGLECCRNFKSNLKFFNLAVFLSLVLTILCPYLPLSLWRLFNNDQTYKVFSYLD